MSLYIAQHNRNTKQHNTTIEETGLCQKSPIIWKVARDRHKSKQRSR